MAHLRLWNQASSRPPANPSIKRSQLTFACRVSSELFSFPRNSLLLWLSKIHRRHTVGHHVTLLLLRSTWTDKQLLTVLSLVRPENVSTVTLVINGSEESQTCIVSFIYLFSRKINCGLWVLLWFASQWSRKRHTHNTLLGFNADLFHWFAVSNWINFAHDTNWIVLWNVTNFCTSWRRS
jgi:hypothetical protein